MKPSPSPSAHDWRAEDADPLAAEDLVEGAGVLAVAVADQEADLLLGEEEAEVARLLGHSAPVRVAGAAGQVDTPGAVLDEEQGVVARARTRASSGLSVAARGAGELG